MCSTWVSRTFAKMRNQTFLQQSLPGSFPSCYHYLRWFWTWCSRLNKLLPPFSLAAVGMEEAGLRSGSGRWRCPGCTLRFCAERLLAFTQPFCPLAVSSCWPWSQKPSNLLKSFWLRILPQKTTMKPQTSADFFLPCSPTGFLCKTTGSWIFFQHNLEEMKRWVSISPAIKFYLARARKFQPWFQAKMLSYLTCPHIARPLHYLRRWQKMSRWSSRRVSLRCTQLRLLSSPGPVGRGKTKWEQCSGIGRKASGSRPSRKEGDEGMGKSHVGKYG